MNKRIVYLLIFMMLVTSLFSKKLDRKFVGNYCDLKKNLNVAIVKVNDKAGITPSDVAIEKGMYRFLTPLNNRRNVFVSIGDAKFAADKCNLGEVDVGKEVTDYQLNCISDNLNRKNKRFGKINNPGDSGWQRNSMQSIDEIEQYNNSARESGSKLLSYKPFKSPETRTLLEELVYSQIENSLVNAEQFTIVDRANLQTSLDEFSGQAGGLIDASSQKELGKMVGADLIGVADITSYTESTKKKSTLGGSERYSVVKMAVILKLIDIESGIIFSTINVSASNEMKGSGKFDKSRAVMMRKFSDNLKSELDESMKTFPFESKAKITKRGSIYLYSGSVDGVKNDMIFDLFISEYDEDEDEFYEDKIGQIIVVDNEKGRGAKAGTKSQCDARDFSSDSLDRDEEYLVRIPQDIKNQMKCK